MKALTTMPARHAILRGHMGEPTPPSLRYLVPVAGPALEPMALEPKPGGLTIGRHERCELLLPASADGVSRFHARLQYDDGQSRWRLSDLNSRWGTFVNGVQVAPGREVPLSEGDLVRISPWTFGFSATARQRGLQTADDRGHTMVRPVSPNVTGTPRDDMLALLLETAAALHDAPDERRLAERLMDAARRGTGLPNAAVLRPADNAGRVDVIAAEMKQAGDAAPSFSRSLIAAAAEGDVAEMTGGAGSLGAAPVSQSIVEMRIATALCVPLMLGGAPAAYLYLDARGNMAAPLRPAATEFCVALGRIASLALANLKRIDIERRQAVMEAELHAAAVAQKWVLPPRATSVGPYRILGESRPGQYVGGDFFDVIDLGDGRLAVAIGDVAGKGVSASVLMTAAQGYLHAVLREHGEPGRAVTAVNRFVSPRRPEHRFVTMWVGVFDPAAGTLCYVDAGHSYALLRDAATGASRSLDAGGGLPVGLLGDAAYEAETVALPARGDVVVVSDGIVEQTRSGSEYGAEGAAFEMEGVQRALVGPAIAGDDDVAAVFSALVLHAGTEQLSDDATAVVIRW